MLPFFPYVANQANNGAPNVSLSQQVTGNSNNGMPNFMQLQGQSQVGFTPNPQNPTPFNSANSNMGPGNQASLQNDQLGKSLLGCAPGMPHPAQQTHGGFGLQNLNAVSGFPLNGSLANLVAQNLYSQQLLANGSTEALNPNACFMNAQLALQNQLQSVNQLLNIALSNPSQLSALSHLIGCGNQVAQGVIPQNNTFPGNPPLGLLQPNGIGQPVNLGQQSGFPNMIAGNALKQFPVHNQQMQMNSCAQSSSGSSLPYNGQAMSSQGNQGNRDRLNVSTPNHRQNKNFKRDRGGASNWRDGSQKAAQNHYAHKMNGKQNFSNENREKGSTKDGSTAANDSKGIKRRSLMMQYSEKEIKQWREERRKYYPTKANIEKKQAHDGKSSGDGEPEAKLRREQLRSILAKQAELGFEVPEIPPHYLSDAEGKRHDRDGGKRPFRHNERFQNRFNKRGRFDLREPFSKVRGTGDREPFGKHVPFASKRQKLDQNDTSKAQLTRRKPTLLEKLLKTDIRRDRCHLLQAFRFMLMNSFFQDDSKPLKFPKVIVKDTCSELEEKLPLEEPSSVVGNLTKIEEQDAREDTSDDSDDEIPKHQVEEGEVTD